jgi:hypothetical protein
MTEPTRCRCQSYPGLEVTFNENAGAQMPVAYRLICDACQLVTDDFITREAAIAAWNKGEIHHFCLTMEQLEKELSAMTEPTKRVSTLQELLDIAYDFKKNDTTTLTRASYELWRDRVLAASAQSAEPQSLDEIAHAQGIDAPQRPEDIIGIAPDLDTPMSAEPQEAISCNGCTNSRGGHYIDTPGSPCIACVDGSKRKTEPQEADLEQAIRKTILYGAPEGPVLCQEPDCVAAYVLDLVRARLASLEQARDDWKCRYEALDAQGYEIARERDALRDRLASKPSRSASYSCFECAKLNGCPTPSKGMPADGSTPPCFEARPSREEEMRESQQLLFSHRMELEKMFNSWADKNQAANIPANVITWLLSIKAIDIPAARAALAQGGARDEASDMCVDCRREKICIIPMKHHMGECGDHYPDRSAQGEGTW